MLGDTGGHTTPEQRRAVMLELYHEHRPALLRFARLLVEGEDAAELVVRMACVRMHASWDGRQAFEAPEDDMRRALFHSARSLDRRSRGRRSEPPVDSSSLTTRERVIASLWQLSPRQRQCVVLRHYAGYTESQTANMIGLLDRIGTHPLSTRHVTPHRIARRCHGHGAMTLDDVLREAMREHSDRDIPEIDSALLARDLEHHDRKRTAERNIVTGTELRATRTH